jgi:peptidoglycan/xylan/chitin deacetylase (PgdA/CDA1 family)
MKKQYIYIGLVLVAVCVAVIMRYTGLFSFSSAEQTIEQQDKQKAETIIPVLMYHHFDTQVTNNMVVSPKRLEEQLTHLKQQGYNTISMKEYIGYVEGTHTLPEKPILITIDDGYLSNYIHAYPLLKKLEMKATIFAVARSVNEQIGLEKFTWAQAKEMYDSGLIEIESHTYDMHRQENQKPIATVPIMRNGQLETEEQYKKRLYDDLAKSKEMIEKNVGNEVLAFAYPYGGYNDTAEAIAQKLFKTTFSIDPGVYKTGDSSYVVKRLNVTDDMTGDDIEKLIGTYSLD